MSSFHSYIFKIDHAGFLLPPKHHTGRHLGLALIALRLAQKGDGEQPAPVTAVSHGPSSVLLVLLRFIVKVVK